jgi:competence protein ComEA
MAHFKIIFAIIMLFMANVSVGAYATDDSMNDAAMVTAQAAIDINAATAQELTQLKGIGPQKAAAIIAYREANGPFSSIEQLAKVKGISLKTIAANKDLITTGLKAQLAK